MIPPNNSISSGSLCDSNSFQLQNYNSISIVRLSLHFIFILSRYYLDITMLYVVVTEIVKDF
ncbi:peptidoglycan N-acetylglucosamine deacetylase [Bacillus mycoides]|nr:peptidoglycan N-acetylglucosamine deacetylase [Bacillus mycoides]QWG51164.1 peptidoglycan N-acetylglucosamine deacetylase [Bacillus mycoides]QWG56730.1 peptidoglycan N-acetylglucosamine deacetylase [Bacillus mycoides]QWG75492.1 peptidoglycan N-acetylglucosamine deacetylase [Bacillus mycoides]QWG84009.1 peptidoglycan N-acetylglucosamine deacetylase [Bacillus mycoides]